MMFALTAALAWSAAILHAGRAGDLVREETWPERIARLGVSLTLVTLAVGLVERARLGDPFLWIHYLILIAVTLATVAHVILFLRRRDDTRRRRHVTRAAAAEVETWLDEVRHLEPCSNPDCQRVRHELAAVAAQLRAHR